MVLTEFFFLYQLLQFSFKNVSSLKILRQAGRYAEKNCDSIILVARHASSATE